ncbi:MAG: tetratricopeptide repeat protein [Bdellovibrionales bacterium]|nr:tetratricopeptide repeat protein [Bdellovibrionales bacterium]
MLGASAPLRALAEEDPAALTSPVPPPTEVSIQVQAGKQWLPRPWKSSVTWGWGAVPLPGRGGTLESPMASIRITLPPEVTEVVAPVPPAARPAVFVSHRQESKDTVVVSANGPFDAPAFAVRVGKALPANVRIRFKTQVARPFFWVSPRCQEFGVGAANRAVRGDPKFLFSALACSEDADELHIDVLRSADAAFESLRRVKTRGQGSAPGVHWVRYATALRPPRHKTPTPFDEILVRELEGTADYRGLLYRGMGPYYEALLDLEAMEAAEPGDQNPSERRFAQGEAALRAGRKPDALEHFRQSRKLDPTQVQPWLLELQLLRELRRERERELVRKAFLEKHPQLKNHPALREAAAPQGNLR